MPRSAVVALVVLGAAGCHGDRSSAPDPSALLQDGFHENGNAFFYWLPPLVNQQAPAEQVFSGQLSPTVTISNLCSGAITRTFSGSQVQIGDDGAYHANWQTTEDALNAMCTYRIAVAVGNRQLGLADLDVVEGGHELMNLYTGEHIPLLDDTTLPIKFFIGVGSQCARVDSDCGEGTAQPGQTTTIVTKNGRAGVFIPAGALDAPATIIIESADERPCIGGLLEPVFAGSIGAIGNSCYDFHTEPPLTEINAIGKFNTNVTVGICVDVGDLEHVTQELLQIFQLHVGAVPSIFALNNVPAPFLTCDPGYVLLPPPPPPLGAHRSLLRSLVRTITAPLVPRPLFASTTMALDVGAGGETDMFSRFTWALPSQLELNFDQAPDLSAILPGAVVNTAYSRLGITFSRTNPLGLCPGTAVYANDYGLLGFHSGQNNVSVCPLGIASDFSQLAYGAIKATFALPAAEACITATPTGYHRILWSGGVAYLEALNAFGSVVARVESSTQRVPQQLCVRGIGITAVRFAGKGAAFAIFDNLRWTRALPASQ